VIKNYSNHVKTRSIYKVVLFLAVPFCGFYTVKLGLSPIYFTFICGFLLLILGSVFGIKKINEKSIVVLLLANILYISILVISTWKFDNQSGSALINLSFTLTYLIIVLLALENSSKKDIVNAAEWGIILSIILLSIELFYRITNPAEPEDWLISREDISWYQYKTSSFMYPDSNSVGIYVACLITFIFGLKENDFRRFKKYIFPLFIILIGSLSRSAILATLLVTAYIHMKSLSKLKFIILGTISISAIVLTISFLEEDESLLSKFWIGGLFLSYISQADLSTLITGVGPGNAEKVLGVGAHLLLFTLVTEIGLMGTILTSYLWMLMWRGSKGGSTPLFLVLLINGLSFSTFAMPWFYTLAAVLIYLSRNSTNASLSSHTRI
jgi:hypothetical protein